MQFISLDKSDYKMLEKNIFRLFKLYTSNRKNHFIEFGLLYFGNEIATVDIRRGIRYFSEVQKNISKDTVNETKEIQQLIEEIITILTKYAKRN